MQESINKDLEELKNKHTRFPHPEPPSHLPPHTIPLGHPSAPAPSILYHPGLVICFTYDITHISVPFSQTIPPSPSPTESKRLFCTDLCLFCCLAYRVIITIFLNSMYMC